MDNYSKQPEEVIYHDFIDAYKCWHKNIWGRLTHVNTNLQILETISQYPLRNIYGGPQDVFWILVYWNFIYASVVLLHGLIKDQAPDTINMNRLKNLLLTKWLIPNERKNLKKD